MKYLNVKGEQVLASDPDRLVWYSAHCGYWSDDWSKLKLFGPGIPCCPVCDCPGFQITAMEWEAGAIKFDEKNSGYNDFLNSHKGHCFKSVGGLMKAWEAS